MSGFKFADNPEEIEETTYYDLSYEEQDLYDGIVKTEASASQSTLTCFKPDLEELLEKEFQPAQLVKTCIYYEYKIAEYRQAFEELQRTINEKLSYL